jgi:putative transposase
LAQAKGEAERIHGRLDRRPFLATDNGPSFVARRFTRFAADQFAHVRIAYRTPTQLGLLERFHRTIKQEEVYWRLYEHPVHARECLAEFRARYSGLRPHWALIPNEEGDPLTPEEVYARGLTVQIPRWQSWARKAKEQLDQMIEKDAE